MTNDTGSELQPQEGQPKERVIELNEWFSPFEDYDSVPYKQDTPTDVRQKRVPLSIANVGKVSFFWHWDQPRVENARRWREINTKLGSPWNTLLVTPFDEKRVNLSELNEEQRKMESRIGQMSVYQNESLIKEYPQPSKVIAARPLPFIVNIELPSGNIVSQQIDSADKWSSQTGEECDSLSIPEIANLLGKIRARIVPLE